MKRLLVGAALTAGVGAATLIRNNRLGSDRRHEEQLVITPEEIEEHPEALQEQPPRQLFRNLKWPTLLGNIGVGAAEVLTGGGSSLAVTVDGVHNIGDAAGYASQFYAEEAKQPEKVHRLRKIGHWVIASSSAIVGSKAAYDLATQNEHAVHPGALAAAGASLALNGYIGRDIIPKVRKYGWRRLSGAQRDIAKHFALVDAPSSVLAVGGALAAGASAHQASATAAVVSGAIGAWVFRPTERNLAEPHSCASHDDHEQSNEESSHTHHQPERQKPTRRRRIAMLGAASMAAAGIVMGAASPLHSPVSSSEPHEQISSQAPVEVEIVSPDTTSDAREYRIDSHIVETGESLWTIAEDDLCQQDNCSNQEIVFKVNQIVERNKIDNPDLIFPGQRLVL